MVLKAKLYHIFLSFRILTHSFLRGLRWAILRAWTQNHPRVVGTCPGHHPQIIGRYRVFEIERPEPPRKGEIEFPVLKNFMGGGDCLISYDCEIFQLIKLFKLVFGPPYPPLFGLNIYYEFFETLMHNYNLLLWL